MKYTEPNKLNLFVLPNQTNTLFGLIVIIFLGAIAAGSVGTQPFMFPLALGLLILPLRAFLARPERELRRHKWKQADAEFSDLVSIVEDKAKAIGLPRIPRLVISEGEIELQALGSLRHWYIVLSRTEALRLQADLNDSDCVPAVQAMFIHELYHYKSGDYWQMVYTQELLRLTAAFMLWAIAFLVGFGFFLLVVQPDVLKLDWSALVSQLSILPPEIREIYLTVLPSAQDIAEMQKKAAEINIVYVLYFIVDATLPFIIASLILWLFYWPKFMRTREIYADAGVVHTLREARSLFYALVLNMRDKPTSTDWLPISWPTRATRWLKIARLAWQRLSRLTFFEKHHGTARRCQALADPANGAYDRWQVTALLIGSLALILEIFLSTPLMLPYQGQWPMHFTVLVVSVVVTLALMPLLVSREPLQKPASKIIGAVVAMRFAWLILTIGLMFFLLVFAPRFLSEALTSAIISIARYTRPLSGPVVKDLNSFVLEASSINLVEMFIVVISLVVLVGVNAMALRHIYTWYSFPQANRWLLRVAYGTIAVTTTFFGLTVLPFVTTLLLRPQDLLDPWMILAGLLGLTIAVIGLGSFYLADRKYGQRCQCGAKPSGWYWLGKQCENCKESLHPWMVAEYENE